MKGVYKNKKYGIIIKNISKRRPKLLIIQLDEAKRTLLEKREDIKELAAALKLDELKEETENLEKLTVEADFWGREDSGTILKRIKYLKERVGAYEELKEKLEDTLALTEMGIEAEDESVTEEVLAAVSEIEESEGRQRIEILLSGEYDGNNAILTLHPGAGGTEAQDWALMLYRMYTRWGEKRGFNVKLLDWLDGEEAGIKSATIRVEGTNAYGYLKSENGVHRLVRVSPFDASGRRHTSFASVEVMPELDDDNNIELKPEELEITAHRSSGAGGQHINKTDSAIRITHLPTGIVVGCQTERSQLQNKETALKMLKAKLLEIKIRENLEKIEDIKGAKYNIEWGSQIRSYVFMPYTLAKDNRTGYEDGNIQAVMDGEIDGFINAYLKMNVKN